MIVPDVALIRSAMYQLELLLRFTKRLIHVRDVVYVFVEEQICLILRDFITLSDTQILCLIFMLLLYLASMLCFISPYSKNWLRRDHTFLLVYLDGLVIG